MPEYSDMIRILIVDDEEAAGNILRVLIDRHLQVPHEIKVSTNPLEALDFIASFHPTLVMLDIEMPGLNGFDFLNKAGNWDFDVIFTTAFDQYAIKAIRFSALDYLLKPIDIIDLQNALNRHIVRRQFGKKEGNPLVGHLMENLSKPTVQEFRLALASSDGTHFVLPADIVRCEGDDNYSRFYFRTGKPFLVSKTLKEYDELLNDHGFLRVHKSHLVNKSCVVRYDREGYLWLSDGSSVPVSRRNREKIRAILVA
jgi:two-component system LytT family response regulator